VRLAANKEATGSWIPGGNVEVITSIVLQSQI
jgi:hypothetical protein